MDKRLYAVVSVILGLLIGLVGNIVFYGKWIGLSFPLFIVICLIALFAFSRIAQSSWRIRNAWMVIPLIFFAVMVAIRADENITFLNIAAVFWLGALLLHYHKAAEPFDQETLVQQGMSVISTGFFIPFEPFPQLGRSLAWVNDHQPLRTGVIRSVGRGLLIAVPVVVVFGVLLASADTIFGNYVTSIMNLFSFRGVDDLFMRGAVIGGIGWIACGALAYGVLREVKPPARYVQIGDQEAEALPADSAEALPDVEELVHPLEAAASASVESAQPRKKQGFSLSMVESGIVLGSVDLLFGAFVMIQFAYFFGGANNVSVASGLTYAEYARRGFFELVAVSVLTLGLILWLDYVTLRRNPTQHTIFRVMALIIVALTGVMLVSASGRMSLYEEAYGLTHLRLYTQVFMLWLAVLFAVFVVAMFRPGTQIFPLGTTLCVIGFLATLNLMNVDYTIAARNVERVEHGHEFDARYLYNLSADAVPVILPFYLNELPEDAPERLQVGNWLYGQLITLNTDHLDKTIFSAHASRDTAWAMLDAAKDKIQAVMR